MEAGLDTAECEATPLQSQANARGCITFTVSRSAAEVRRRRTQQVGAPVAHPQGRSPIASSRALICLSSSRARTVSVTSCWMPRK